MYSWATPEYLLYNMSLQQWSKYYKGGWESRKTNAQMFWGVLGEALSGDNKNKKTVSIEDFRKQYSDGKQTENGYTVTR
jgi:hypothetical protein